MPLLRALWWWPVKVIRVAIAVLFIPFALLYGAVIAVIAITAMYVSRYRNRQREQQELRWHS